MYSQTVMVINPTGVHARPAADFVRRAKEFKSKIKVKNLSNIQDPEAVNAKSITSVLSIAICLGNTIEISAAGDDEQQAVEALKELVESGFGEI